MYSKTAVIQIGNSDDKLSQHGWSEFVDSVNTAISDHYAKIYFASGSQSDSPWQNYCYVIEIDSSRIYSMKCNLSEIARNFNQESIAWMEGYNEMILGNSSPNDQN
jgi:hypothetical protein